MRENFRVSRGIKPCYIYGRIRGALEERLGQTCLLEVRRYFCLFPLIYCLARYPKELQLVLSSVIEYQFHNERGFFPAWSEWRKVFLVGGTFAFLHLRVRKAARSPLQFRFVPCSMFHNTAREERVVTTRKVTRYFSTSPYSCCSTRELTCSTVEPRWNHSNNGKERRRKTWIKNGTTIDWKALHLACSTVPR